MPSLNKLTAPTNEEALHLIALAKTAIEKAYAPYSRYRVGAAALAESGNIYDGANVENLSYGGTICAERTAIIQMVMAGDTRIRAIAIVTPDFGFPCGMCLQMLAEFAPFPEQCWVVVPTQSGPLGFIMRTLSECAPYLWSSEIVKQNTELP